MMGKITGYKGLDKEFNAILGDKMQFEVGKTYIIDGKLKGGKNGFHFCKNPLDVFEFYSPAESRFCIVESDGETIEHGTKTVARSITIIAETGYRSAATNTGAQSAAIVEGCESIGCESIAIVTGYQSKAKGAKGSWLVLTERDDDFNIVTVKSIKVDGKKIKSNTFYMLEDKKIIEVPND